MTRSRRPTLHLSTFSIVGADPEAGDVGVAVQSKFLAVGAIVPWARGGVGAAARDGERVRATEGGRRRRAGDVEARRARDEDGRVRIGSSSR